MKSLWYSPTLRGALVYGASGLGFAGANLILARVLPTSEYAVFTLVIALVNLAFALAPLGIDGMVNRRHLEAGPQLLKRTLVGGLATGLVFIAIGAFAYDLDTALLFLIFVSTVAGGAMSVAGSQFQSEQRYGISLALTQSPNLALLAAALAAVVAREKTAGIPLLIGSAGFLLAGSYGWWRLFQEREAKTARGSEFPWSEALSYAGLNAAGLVLVQLDRLVIPQVLPLQDLATFGVLAAIVGSWFRVLFMGVGYTLVPRLRAAAGVLERRRLIAYEAKLVGAIVVIGSIVIWFATPPVERLFLDGKYHLTGALVLAAIFSGVAKIANAFTKSTVAALATPSELALVNVLGWVAVALAIPLAVIGARWGLVGVIYGVGMGWLLRALSALFLTFRHLRVPAAVPVTSP